MLLSKQRQWEISTGNSDWDDETIWNEIAKAQLQAVVDDLKIRIDVLKMRLRRAKGVEIFSIGERIDELENLADSYEQELK